MPQAAPPKTFARRAGDGKKEPGGAEGSSSSQMSAQSLFYVPVDDDEQQQDHDEDEDENENENGWQQQSSITVSKLFRNLKTHFHSFSR